MLLGQQLESVKDGPMNLPLKFGQNWVSNSRDITDMDIYCRDKCCLDKCHHGSWNLFKRIPGTYLEGFIKIGSVTADIFLIWTNIVRTNVAWTNAEILLTLSLCGGWWVVVKNHFNVKPNPRLG